jgi:hypothetical protein
MALSVYDEFVRILSTANAGEKMVIGVGLNDLSMVTEEDLVEARSIAELVVEI